MDENDGYDNWLWPDVATFPSGTPAEQMRQIYGSLMQRMTTDLYHEKKPAHLRACACRERRYFLLPVCDL